MNAREVFYNMTGRDGVPVAGYYFQPPGGVPAEVVVFPDVIFRFKNHPWSIFNKYTTHWAPLTHTLLHELCHHEEVERDLIKTNPDKDPHELIDFFVRDKILLPLEMDERRDNLWQLLTERH